MVLKKTSVPIQACLTTSQDAMHVAKVINNYLKQDSKSFTSRMIVKLLCYDAWPLMPRPRVTLPNTFPSGPHFGILCIEWDQHIVEENRLSKIVEGSECSLPIKFIVAHFVFHCTQRLSNNFPMRMLVGQVAIVFIRLFSLWHFNDPCSPRGLNRSSFSWLFCRAH